MSEIVALLKSRQFTRAIQELKDLLNQPQPLDSTETAVLWNYLGFSYEQTGHLEKAGKAYQKAIDYKPEHAEYHNNLGILRTTQGDLQGAYKSFEQVLSLKPDAQSFLTLAQICKVSQKEVQALDFAAQAHFLAPRWSAPIELTFELMEALSYRPEVLQHLQDKWSESQALFYLIAIGAYYQATNHEQTAQRYFRQALANNESYGLMHIHLINSLHNDKNYTDAFHWALQFYGQTPSLANAHTVLSSIQEPIPLSTEHIKDIEKKLNHYLDFFLEQHHAELTRPAHLRLPHSLSFYHCYQFKNLRPIQKKLAQFYRLPQSIYPNFSQDQTSKPKLGILSHHFYDQSVMHLLQRALEHLIQSQNFEVFIFFYAGHTPRPNNPVTDKFQKISDHFINLSTDPLQASYQIAKTCLDILIYPEVGMNPFVYAMASQRLARFQMVMSGHPVTTGLPHMDYFVSSQILETEHGQNHYSENLITLPGLPDYAPVTIPPPASRQVLGLPEIGSLYFCPMTLFKIHPDFDAVLKQILEKDSQGHVLFLAYNDLELRLQQRFHQSLGEALLSRIHFLPWSNRETFYQRLMACDVILDSFYFGGGNTSYQALGLGCPIVTLDLPWNRSRWTQTMYQLMDFTSLIAKEPDHYAELAVSVATNPTWNQELRQALQRKSTVLFDNPTWSESLLQFCQTLLNT